MARMGLGSKWHCTFANDFDKKKAQAYAISWGDEDLSHRDIKSLTTAQLPGTPKLAWASFPCQNLSLAGSGAGLRGQKSSTFWSFWNLIKELGKENRAPDVIVLENVVGAITSDKGRDFDAII
jgi:DNA (cytosine-5)-methyltransferase 1